MNDFFSMILTGLFDTDCGQSAIEEAMMLMELRQTENLIKHLRRCRCELIDKMHESQRRVDRMDYLIQQASRITNEQ